MRTNYQEKILEGARQLFYQHGIKKITMDDIASHLSISKKTIYREFADKNEIVKGICLIDFEQHRSIIDKHQTNSENAIKAIVQIMKYVHEYLDGINPEYFYNMQKYHSSAWNLYIEFKSKFIINSVVKNLLKGQQEGLYRSNLNINILSRLRIAEMDAALDTDLYPPSEFSLVEINDELLRHFLQGITTIKGHQLINEYLKIDEAGNAQNEMVYAANK